MASNQDLIDQLSGGVQDKLDSLNLARDEALAAAEENQVWRDNALRSDTAFPAVYLNSILGDDANDGNTRQSALATWESAIRRTRSLGDNDLRLTSNIDALAQPMLFNGFNNLRISGRRDDDSAGQQRELRFVKNPGVNQMGGLIWRGPSTLRFENIVFDLQGDADSTDISPIWALDGRAAMIFVNCGFRHSGGNVVPMIAASGQFDFYNHAIRSDADGLIIRDIPTGTNPNSIYGVESNLTSLGANI